MAGTDCFCGSPAFSLDGGMASHHNISWDLFIVTCAVYTAYPAWCQSQKVPVTVTVSLGQSITFSGCDTAFVLDMPTTKLACDMHVLA